MRKNYFSLALMVTSGTAVALAVSSGGGCGGGAAVCGDSKVEGDEQCDKGAQNGQKGIPCSAACKSISVPSAKLNINWKLLGNLNPSVDGYKPAGCADFGATKAHLIIVGPTDDDGYDRLVNCEDRGLMYVGVCPEKTDAGQGDCKPLHPGKYTVTVTLQGDTGLAVTAAISTPPIEVTENLGAAVQFTIDFEPNDFLKQNYTGTFKFNAHWGAMGKKCADAAITSESILLVPDGKMIPVKGKTKDGTPLDGMPGKCYVPGPNDFVPGEEIANLPWGRYNLGIYSQAKAFCMAQKIFVNPGTNPYAYQFVVPMFTAPTDAGAPGDGGVMTCP